MAGTCGHAANGVPHLPPVSGRAAELFEAFGLDWDAASAIAAGAAIGGLLAFLRAGRRSEWPALARRFQPVLVPEPSVPDSITILRGLREKYQVHHGVHITDGAVVAAVSTLGLRLAAQRRVDRALPRHRDVLTKRAITDRLCEATGCAPVWWAGSPRHDRVLDASVSNAYAKGLGLMLHHPSMIDWYLSTRDAGEAQRPRSIS